MVAARVEDEVGEARPRAADSRRGRTSPRPTAPAASTRTSKMMSATAKLRLPSAEEEPRDPRLGPVEVDAEADREGRADADAVVEDRLRRPARDQEVDAGQHDAAGEEERAGVVLAEARAEIHDRPFTLGNTSPASNRGAALGLGHEAGENRAHDRRAGADRERDHEALLGGDRGARDRVRGEERSARPARRSRRRSSA